MARWVILLKNFNSEYAWIPLGMTRNDSEWLGMAKYLSLKFFLGMGSEFTRIPTIPLGICSDPLGFLPFRSDPLGMCGGVSSTVARVL